ncbi:MAG: long-chain fatty acid--CoA ligase [Verrucomicrobiales bacterium]|nr:long-chain fatty acid--CoA ligase [Verrucomicrobiales bacterium]MCP5527108.1 long-chain fatty acid--CoA ligase [Verrucomicrobiales bacterium]
MTSTLTFQEVANRLVGQMRAGRWHEIDAAFNELALDLFRLQFDAIPVYRRLCEARGRTPDVVTGWHEIPTVPTRSFKDQAWTSLAETEHTRVFHSSGTTFDRPSRHHHNAASLAVYEASLTRWFARHLRPDAGEGADPRLLALTPSPGEAPLSSLVHMIGTVMEADRQRDGEEDRERFMARVGTDGAWGLDTDRAMAALSAVADGAQPVCLLGTAFSFVHLLEALEGNWLRLALPKGSRVMETGGYKGRSQELPRSDLHAWITARLGVASAFIVCEYGMTELSSQAYDHVAGDALPEAGRCFRFPPWARARVVSMENGREVAMGEVGLLEVFDLANVRSVLAVQTGDLAVRRAAGFELVGRAPEAEARGCSLMPTAGTVR